MIQALILTIILECTVLFILGERSKIFYLYWCAVTALTNICANLYIVFLFSGGEIEYWITAAIIEILVVIAEFLLCLAYTNDKKTSIKYSSICNATSFFVGLIVQFLVNIL